MDQVRGSQTTFLHSEKGKSEKQKSTTKGQSIANGHLQSSSKRLSNFFCLVSVRSEKRKRGIFGCFSTYACFREREREREREKEGERERFRGAWRSWKEGISFESRPLRATLLPRSSFHHHRRRRHCRRRK